MHIADGILTWQWSIAWYIIAIFFVALGARKIAQTRKANPAYMSILALMGAAIFVISVWHIPVAFAGTSSHPNGTALAAIIIGPLATAAITSIVLFFQAFLGHGGITSLGANLISLGVVGGFVGISIYLLLKKLGASVWLAAGVAGFIGDLSTYAFTALQLAFSLNPGSVGQHWEIYMLGYLPTQIPLAILEFAFTAAAVQYIQIHRPEIFTWWKGIPTITTPTLANSPKPVDLKVSNHKRHRIDKFTKYALVTMTVIIAIMLVSTYVGVNVFGGKMGGTDSSVASGGFSFLTHYTMVDEYVVFTIGGAAGGLVVGYLLPSIFGQMSKRTEEKQNV
jgi:cobalt/nickel transport system permease protein